MESIFTKACELIDQNIPFAYSVIVQQEGSAPRGLGSKMLITADTIYETIGGGGMEGHVIAQAREKVLTDHKPILHYYDLNTKAEMIGDFICGGDCEVLTFFVDPENTEYQQLFAAADAATQAGKKGWFVYVVNTDDDTLKLSFITQNESIVGNFQGSDFLPKPMLMNPIRIAIHSEEEEGIRYFVDFIHRGGRLYLFGGGHVSKEVAKIASGMEFHVVVIDDRAEFANSERFPGCEIMVIDDFNDLPDLLVDDDTYILIITRGHAHDKTVLAWSMTKTPYYTGMIGSKSKRDTVYAKLLDEGVPQARIDAVHSPVGLPIGAQTPAEIAVSIMAEIIDEKYKKPESQD